METDYLVVGAGAIGMAFVDSLIGHSDAEVVMIDRRHRPGGHWLDSYPFVQLHQPSWNYGVNSSPLGENRVEADGRDAGFYERASGYEICAYYDDVMRHRLLASGRVRFFPMCEYLGDRRYRSQLTGEEAEVSVRRAVVDATYMTTRVPATDPPPFDIADGVQWVPVGGLARVSQPPDRYVIIGAGKTAMDAATWLLDQGTAPDRITWIRPGDSWILNRAYFQPGDGVATTLEGVVRELEAINECDSITAVYGRLEEHQVVLRLDPTVEPTMLRGATASRGEVDELRRIEDVIRHGYVTRIGIDDIELEDGSIPTSVQNLHVHCAAPGLSDRPPKPIFADDTVTLQPITRVSLSLSAALTGFVEASDRDTSEKNRLCRANAWPQTPFDFVRHLLMGMKTEMEWLGAPDVQQWVEASRLNLVAGINDDPDRARVADLQGRFLTALGPALAKFEKFAEDATPTERARIY